MPLGPVLQARSPARGFEVKRMIFLAALLIAQTAFADWYVGNGGNPDALDFLKNAQTAIAAVQSDPIRYPQVENLDLDILLDDSQLLVSESPLYINEDNVRQEVAAINFRNPNTIVLARDLWRSIQDPSIKKALALHEVLGLAGVEDTGQYFVSEKYLASLGVNCTQDLCVPQAPDPNGLLAANAQRAFEGSSKSSVGDASGFNPYSLASGMYDPSEIWSTTSLLRGSSDNSAAMVDLSSEGATDWIEWGDVTSRKATDTHVLPDFSYLQPDQSVNIYSDDQRPILWSDGYPSAVASENRNGISVTNGANGFSFTAPSDQNVRTLVVHVSEWNGAGRLTAELEDGSAVVYRDIVPKSVTSNGYDRNYTITYSSKSPTRLKINWFVFTPMGNINLSAAALSLTGSTRATNEVDGSWSDSTAPVDLTKEGTSDWIHWGDLSLNRKSTGEHQISDFTRVNLYSADPRWSKWTDGASGAQISPQQSSAGLSQLNNGFIFKIPVDNLQRTLIVHLGGHFSGGIFTATLDDGSGYIYSDEVESTEQDYDRNYTLTFNASKPSTLTVTWKMTSGLGFITINSMSLR